MAHGTNYACRQMIDLHHLEQAVVGKQDMIEAALNRMHWQMAKHCNVSAIRTTWATTDTFGPKLELRMVAYIDTRTHEEPALGYNLARSLA